MLDFFEELVIVTFEQLCPQILTLVPQPVRFVGVGSLWCYSRQWAGEFGFGIRCSVGVLLLCAAAVGVGWEK